MNDLWVNYTVSAAELPMISAVETEIYGPPDPDDTRSWTSLIHSETFIETLVARNGSHVIGFLIALVSDKEVDILNVAVAPDYRRQGAGTLLVQSLIEKQYAGPDQNVFLTINERYLDQLNFFKQNQFRAIQIVKHQFDEDDGFLMIHQKG